MSDPRKHFTAHPGGGQRTADTGPSDDDAEDRMIEKTDRNLHEMQGAMAEMFTASSQFMKAFIDMRLSYLKVMREGVDDPATAMSIWTKNMQDVAKAMNDAKRKQE